MAASHSTSGGSGPTGPGSGAYFADLDLDTILTAVEETAYLWDIGSDRIQWASNAAAVLRLTGIEAVSTGQSFQFQIAPEHVAIRSRMLTGGDGAGLSGGLPYRVQYRFLPDGRRSDTSVWVEDHGRCWYDEGGRATHACGVLRIIDDRWREEQKLIYRSDYDDLTGQLNKVRLTEALSTVIDRAARTGQPAAFLVAAIRNLEHINESFGFDVGDEVVAAAGRLIRSRVRGGDTLGRYSANKFGIILGDCGPGAMRVAADRFVSAVRNSVIKTSACPIQATLVIGGVLIPDHAASVSQAVGHALEALERARASQGMTFCGYEPSPVAERSRLRNITIADEVVAALEDDRMRLVLQPVVHAHSREPAFYEALLRMQRSDGVIVCAANFIEIAEQVGLSRLIDRRTMELAVQMLIDDPALRISLNVSANTCVDTDWLLALRDRLTQNAGVAPRLIIEITETSMIGDVDAMIAFIDTLHEQGCRVAIDDFGAGYTSFRNLKRLRADMVKIDGAFVHALSDHPEDIVYLRTLAQLAQACGMETVAEWVADEATARIIEDLGITHMQGFLFGRPFPDVTADLAATDLGDPLSDD